MVLRVFLILAIAAGSLCQIPIPKRPLGFVYNGGEADAPVHLDVYMGPLCPDSQMAFPTITQLAISYGPKTLRLNIHLFPLPYHRNSFLVAMGQHVVDQVTNGNMSYTWMKNIYADLNALSNTATADQSENQVKDKLSQIASTVGVSKSVFLSLMNNVNIDENTRIGWKYTCSRGVSGTPTFMVNDVLVGADASWTVNDWKKVIDPLLQSAPSKSNTTCKIGTKKCEYLPGQIECCTPGENCIPNVGCRC
ncbi:hypothetical protein KUTeg_010475 [Tegillarca granosa]|uniref:DSBA-like thioredoxin domain-containing protein n=1 Tax=Tegillarca granosa TaxID=220873 RepID=A0ABQ9F6W7_TEGGR|nr:hypothetical protein KUTeg_010475 [Tegillarca granosa]